MERQTYIFRNEEAASKWLEWISARENTDPVLEHPDDPKGKWATWRVHYNGGPTLEADSLQPGVTQRHWGRSEYHREYGNNSPHRPDFERCCVSVYSAWSSSQCGRKAAHDPDHTGKPTRCKIHSRAYRKGKAEIARAKWDAEEAARAERRREREGKDAALALIEKIADGHNDPRGAALDLLIDYGFRPAPE